MVAVAAVKRSLKYQKPSYILQNIQTSNLTTTGGCYWNHPQVINYLSCKVDLSEFCSPHGHWHYPGEVLDFLKDISAEMRYTTTSCKQQAARCVYRHIRQALEACQHSSATSKCWCCCFYCEFHGSFSSGNHRNVIGTVQNKSCTN